MKRSQLALATAVNEIAKLKRETAWLVEWPGDQDQPVRWWHPKHGWTIDASRAMRFSREQDAQDYIDNCGPGGLRMPWAIATEHMWH